MKKKLPTLGQQRLAKLAKFLYTVPARKFYMGTWATSESINNCGSQACAIGWASTIFKNEGLALSRYSPWEALRPQFGDLSNWLAVEKFFDLSNRTANRLFGAQDTGPRGVAQRIKGFLKTGKVPKI